MCETTCGTGFDARYANGFNTTGMTTGDCLDSFEELLEAGVALLRREYDSLVTAEERFYLVDELLRTRIILRSP